MPSTYTGSQKQYISQFTSFTQAKDTVAVRFLKAHGWNLDQAIDAYFQSPQGASSNAAITSLNRIFDSYRDDPADNPDGIGIEGTMKYLGDIQVRLDEVACFGVAELVKSPSMGEFTREGFVEGWRASSCDTLQKMISHSADLRLRIMSQPNIFRQVYRYAFLLCRLQGQRNLSFEIACDQWQLFFTSSSGGIDWSTSSTPWLDWYLEFLDSRGKRPVNKDLWEQTEVFMRRTKEDESLSWWSPDGAWPGTLDDFVAWVKEKRGDDNKVTKETEAMEVE